MMMRSSLFIHIDNYIHNFKNKKIKVQCLSYQDDKLQVATGLGGNQLATEV